MNLHLEYDKFSVFKKQLKDLNDKIKGSHVTVNLHYLKKFSVKPYSLLKRRLVNVAFTVDVKNLSYSAINIVNVRKIKLTLTATRPLTKKDVKKLKLLKELTVIKPLNEAAERSVKNANLDNLILVTSSCNDALKADVYNLCLSLPPTFHCFFTSCLGKNLYVARNGNLSFCPENPNGSLIGNVSDEGEIFSHPRFNEVLEKQIARRNECLKNCKLFSKCKGGCALTDTCESFKENYKRTKTEIADLISKNKPLKEQNRVFAEAVLKSAVNGNFFKVKKKENKTLN